MANITASLVKELRERTGAGMMECKKALTETNGDIEAAIENMRKSGQAKAAKKAGRTAAEGVLLFRVSADNKRGYVVELNCETDFVAKDAGFLALANKVADYAVANDVTSVETVKEHFEEERAHLVAKIGENMSIRRLEVLSGDFIGGYSHGSKIVALANLSAANEDVAKKLGMHIASSRPDYLNEAAIPAEVVAKETQFQTEKAHEEAGFAKKPENIQEKIISGRIEKFKSEICLVSQPFVMDPSISVADFLKQSGVECNGFIRLEVGEGIEKKEEDFAAEVAKVTGSFK